MRALLIIAFVLFCVGISNGQIGQAKYNPPPRLFVLPGNTFDLPPSPNHGISCQCTIESNEPLSYPIAIAEDERVTKLEEQLELQAAKIEAITKILLATREQLEIVEEYCVRLEGERKKVKQEQNQ